MTDMPDVDVEVMHREDVVKLFPTAVPASQIAGTGANTRLVRHISGLYFQDIPRNPLNGCAAFPKHEAEDFGFYSVDLLSCPHPYDGIETMDELRLLLDSPIDWDWFLDSKFVSTLFHFNGIVYDDLTMAEVVSWYRPGSISDLAVLVAIKLPAKKHLIGEDFEIVKTKIWTKEKDRGRQFRKSHSVAYAMVVGLDARLKAPGFFGI